MIIFTSTTESLSNGLLWKKLLCVAQSQEEAKMESASTLQYFRQPELIQFNSIQLLPALTQLLNVMNGKCFLLIYFHSISWKIDYFTATILMPTNFTTESSKRCLVAPERYAELQSNMSITSKKDLIRETTYEADLPCCSPSENIYVVSCYPARLLQLSAALLSFDILVHSA